MLSTLPGIPSVDCLSFATRFGAELITFVTPAVFDGIIFEPVGGTAMSQVARAAAAAGIGWAVLNRDAEYIPELRKLHTAPVFTVSSDHEEIGRIQGRQIAALLPKGGEGFYITGPSESSAAKERTTGMYETKPVAMQLRV